jgi:RsiW-degrading membrane proteinase PrsW (M82 family)
VIHAFDVLRVVLAFAPVLLFLAALRGLDSYKLVSVRTILAAVAAGASAAALCFAITSSIFLHFPALDDQYALFVAPIVEELAKGAFWIFLIATARAVFMADSAICGFAVGAGFALVENLSYFHLLEARGIGIWILRGFGTAVMHGGVAALGATLTAYLLESSQRTSVLSFVPGQLAAVLLHSLFNQSLQSPVASTLGAILGLPVILVVAFYFSERSLRRWLGGKLDQDIDMLSEIGSKEFRETHVGTYLAALEESFSPTVRGDMLSLLQLTCELSMRAKSQLLLREAGLQVEPDPDLEGLFAELKYLVKSIGPTGMLAVRPLLSQTPRDLWEMHRLGSSVRRNEIPARSNDAS